MRLPGDIYEFWQICLLSEVGLVGARNGWSRQEREETEFMLRMIGDDDLKMMAHDVSAEQGEDR